MGLQAPPETDDQSIDHRPVHAWLIAKQEEHGAGTRRDGRQSGSNGGALTLGIVRIDDDVLTEVPDSLSDRLSVRPEHQNHLVETRCDGMAHGVTQ